MLMYKRIFNGMRDATVTRIKDQANFMVIEMASGVYHVMKDRFDAVGGDEYCTANKLVAIFNEMERVVVLPKERRYYYSNSQLENFNNNF